jgi:hypothetical protein
MKSLVSRFGKSVAAKRLAAGVIGASAALMAAAVGPASAQSSGVFQGIRIDLSGLPGASQTRADMQACLASALPKVLGSRINPGARGAPVLTVRPTSIYFANTSNVNSNSGPNGGSSQIGLDEIDGDAIIGGQVIRIKAANSPISGAHNLPESIARLRTVTLCNNFVFALARRV